MLEFKVENQRLALLLDDVTVVADSQDYLKAHFAFSNDWDDVVKIALFTRDENNIRVALDNDNIAVVPYQVLQGGGCFDISVFGNNQENADNMVITSSVVTVDVRPSGLKNGETFDESEAGLEGGVLWQIRGKATEAQESATAAHNDAEAAARSAADASDAKDAAVRSAGAAAESAETATRAAQTAASDAATAAAAQAAEQTAASITQTFSEFLNAPHYSYDEQGHLIFVYGREVG